MFGSSVLDIGIGLIFVFLILGLVCTASNELLAGVLAWRATNLREGVRNLLDGPNPNDVEWVEKFYRHPLIQTLGRPGGRPSYIPSHTFALALLDLVLPPGVASHASTPADLTIAVEASSCPPGLKQVLLILIAEAQHASVAGQQLRRQGVLDIQKLDTFMNQVHTNVEVWFNGAMERVTGWYKRRVQLVTFAVAILFAAGLNLDTVLIARHLSRDAALRSAIVAEAEQLAKEPEPTTQGTSRTQLVEERITELKSVGIPFGWPDSDAGAFTAEWVLVKVLGLLLTACAASLGAPFWFDVLNRVISIRAAGKAPEEAPLPPRQIPYPAAPGQTEGSGPPPAPVPAQP
jgi:hypothetical protein